MDVLGLVHRTKQLLLMLLLFCIWALPAYVGDKH